MSLNKFNQTVWAYKNVDYLAKEGCGCLTLFFWLCVATFVVGIVKALFGG